MEQVGGHGGRFVVLENANYLQREALQVDFCSSDHLYLKSLSSSSHDEGDNYNTFYLNNCKSLFLLLDFSSFDTS